MARWPPWPLRRRRRASACGESAQGRGQGSASPPASPAWQHAWCSLLTVSPNGLQMAPQTPPRQPPTAPHSPLKRPPPNRSPLTYPTPPTRGAAGTWEWLTSRPRRGLSSFGGTPRQATPPARLTGPAFHASGGQGTGTGGQGTGLPNNMAPAGLLQRDLCRGPGREGHAPAAPPSPAPGARAPLPPPQDHPFAQLSGSDNIIAFTTQRYSAKARRRCMLGC